jgi:hypothetical protein
LIVVAVTPGALAVLPTELLPVLPLLPLLPALPVLAVLGLVAGADVDFLEELHPPAITTAAINPTTATG